MNRDAIRTFFRESTKPVTKPIFRKERIVPDETDAITRMMRITRRQRASRIISGFTPDGRQYVLVKYRNNMI